jgi:hypothetical protein
VRLRYRDPLVSRESDLRERLDGVRAELRDASRIIAMIKLGAPEDGAPEPLLFARRREIELRVAELRLTLWSKHRDHLERELRALGIRP